MRQEGQELLDQVEEIRRLIRSDRDSAAALALLVAERFPEAEVVGVDLAPEMISEARRLRPPALEERVAFEVADAGSRLPFADGSFAAITCTESFHWYPDQPAALRLPRATPAYDANGAVRSAMRFWT